MNRTTIEWTNWSVNALKLQLPNGALINACVHKSRGCEHCYAETLTCRWWKKEWGEFPGYTPALLKMGKPVLVEKELEAVLRLSQRITAGKSDPKINRIFWHDMTDEYLDFWPDELLDRAWAVRALTPNLIHQVLTKRPERMYKYCKRFADNRTHLNAQSVWASEMANWIVFDAGLRPIEDVDESESGSDYVYDELREATAEGYLSNVYLLVSSEDQPTANERIGWLLKTPAAVRGVSYEPALGPVDFRPYIGGPEPHPLAGESGMEDDAQCCVRCGCVWETDATHECPPGFGPKLDQIICGGESGPGARPMELDWVRSVRDQCEAAGVAFFFKQAIINGKKVGLPLLDGEQYAQFPNTI